MPLLVITGLPASGKSTIVSRIVSEFKKHGYENISIVDEEVFGKKFYGDFKKVFKIMIVFAKFKEKENRDIIRSCVQRLLNKNHLVICDSLNYIKGNFSLF